MLENHEGNRVGDLFSIHSQDLERCRQSRMAFDEKRGDGKLGKLGKRAYFLRVPSWLWVIVGEKFK